MPQQELWSAVDHYLEQAHGLRDPALDAALAANRAASLPQIDVAPNQGRLLHLLAQMAGARRILEIGTLGGYSTIWLARALPPDGELLSLELEPAHANVARINLARAGFAENEQVEVRVGDALEALQRMVELREPAFDFVFIDADKERIADYVAQVLALSHVGTVIVVDNVVRQGAIADAASSEPRVQGVRRFLDGLADEPRLEATTLQTVGAKGHDGFTLMRVIDPSPV